MKLSEIDSNTPSSASAEDCKSIILIRNLQNNFKYSISSSTKTIDNLLL